MKTVRAYFSTLVIVLIISHLRAMTQCPSTIDANFADALRTLYPAQNFVDASNTLTSNVTSYTGTLDFKGWGNATTSSGANSLYASKPKLTTIDGIQCFTSLTKLNVNNQNLTGALPAVALTITELRCQTNNLTSLPSLPPNLTYLDCRINQISALPDLPATLKYLICGANKLSSIPKLPDGLLYLKCNIQHTKAPSFTISSESDKLLASLPELPDGLLALNCTDNKITSLTTLPSTLVYLNAQNNPSLKCLPAFTNPSFFTAALPSNAYFTDGGTLAEPRLNLTNTAVGCMPNLPAGWTTSKITPTSYASTAALCSNPPVLTASSSTCSLPGLSTAFVSLTANGGGALEYSADGTTYQSSTVLLNLPAGTQPVFVRRKSDSVCPSTVLSTTVIISQCNPQTYYANYATGIDQPDQGTSASSPWKTISYALSRIQPDQGSTLQLSAGTFEETNILTVPSGINIVGVGSGQSKTADSTVVKVNYYYDMLSFPQSITYCSVTGAYYKGPYSYSYDPAWGKFVIQINGNNQLLKGFKLDGQAKQCHGGVFMRDGINVVLDDLKLLDFQFAGIWLAKSTNAEIKNNYLRNNAFGNDLKAIGNINFWNGINLSIHDNYIEETAKSFNTRPDGDALGAYGIKILEAVSTSFCETGGYFTRWTNTPSTFKIYNNTIKVLAKGTWVGGLAPAISIELIGNQLVNSELYNNYVNNHISIPASLGYTPAVRGVSVRVHDNFFDLGSKYSYGVEATCPGLEIDHNFFSGGYYPISEFDAGRDVHDQDIHHNVFYGFQGGRQNFMNYSKFPTGFRFNNNTLVITRPGLGKLFNLDRGKSSPTSPATGAQIKNNVIINLTQTRMDSIYKTTDPKGSTIFNNPDISNNLFYNTQSFGRDSIAIDSARLATSILQLTGDKPRPYFELAAGSPAVDAGVEIPGITDGYQGTKPDLGAYESSQTVNLSVVQQDGDGGQTTNNQIKPFLQLNNAGNTGVPYQDLKARYWLTAEDFAPINTWIDYAPVGNSNVKLAYVPLAQPRQGALGYLEYNFDPAAGTLNGAGNSGVIQSRVAKADWTAFNETDDYSFGDNAALTPNSKITLYRNGVLAWGTEPAGVPVNQALTVQTENRNNSPSTNTISTYLKISNVGNVPVNYKDLKVRYWFTADGTPPLNYWIDYAQVGNGNIKGSFVKPATALTGADTYFELAVDSTVGTLYPLSSSGNVQYRLAKNDWSNFDETNDYSYKASAPMADNDHVAVYYKEQLVYGTEPVSGSRLAAESPKSELNNVVLYPNPSTGGRLFIRSGGATISRVDLTTITGQIVPVEVASPTGDEVQVTPARTLTPGIYLLIIHTSTGIVTRRVLVSETGFRAN